MTEAGFDYDNRTGRDAGRFVRALGALVPGVARVRGQADPYADAWREHNLRALAMPGRRWVVLGDSMAQGVGATTHDVGWVGQLQRRLAAAGHDLVVVNLSATGARVPDVVAQQLPLLRTLPPTGAGSDLVTVLVGSNDLFGGPRHRAGLPEAFRALLGGLPVGSVVATLPQPRSAARRANRHVEDAVREGRVAMVDMRMAGPDTWRGRLAADWFHPNDAGYAALADAFEPVVLQALSQTVA